MDRNWIKDILQAYLYSGQKVGWKPLLDVKAFESLVAWLRHRVLETEERVESDPVPIQAMLSAFTGLHANQFERDARSLSGKEKLSLRRGDVGFRCENVLMSRHMPPHASDVRRALRALLCEANEQMDSCVGDPLQSLVLSFLATQVLLTIHPLQDGNGRTARFYFAAQVARNVGPAPSVVLAWLLLKRSGAHQYHQCSWLLRSGDPLPMIELFLEGERIAEDIVRPRLATGAATPALLADCYDALVRYGVVETLAPTPVATAPAPASPRTAAGSRARR